MDSRIRNLPGVGRTRTTVGLELPVRREQRPQLQREPPLRPAAALDLVEAGLQPLAVLRRLVLLEVADDGLVALAAVVGAARLARGDDVGLQHALEAGGL